MAGTLGLSGAAGHAAVRPGPAALAGLRYTTSQAGYVTGGGRYFRFVATTVTVAPAAVPAGNASSAEVVLGSTAGPPATLRVAAGGGAGSVTYTWSSGTETRTGTLSGVAPAPGDVLTLSVYYDQAGQDFFTAADLTQGDSQTVRVDVVPVIYTAAEAAAVVDNATVVPPASDTRLWAFTGTHVTTYTGVRGTLLGPWATYQVIDTTTATPSGAVVISAPVLWDSGQNFGAWLRAAGPRLTVKATIPLSGSPDGIALNPRTSTLYVASSAAGRVSVINTQTGRVTAAVTVGSDPIAVAVNPETNTIYAANYSGDTVSVINGRTNQVTKTIQVGLVSPWRVAVNPETNMVYVTGLESDTVSVINGQTNQVTATIWVGGVGGGVPLGVAVNPRTDTVYVSINGGPMAVINGRTNTVVATVSGCPAITAGIAVNPRTDTIYVDDAMHNLVSVVSGRTNTLTATVPVGDLPNGAAVNPRTGTVYVTNANGSTLSAINGQTNRVVATVSVGRILREVAVDPRTDIIYVTSAYGGGVSVLGWFR